MLDRTQSYAMGRMATTYDNIYSKWNVRIARKIHERFSPLKIQRFAK